MLRYTIRQLEYFVAVGAAKSIQKAAEKVNVSSPTISSAINQLEKELGLSLFVRQHAQGMTLTLAGKRLFEQAKSVLNEAEHFVDLAGDISGTTRGPLSVGCLLTFAQVVLPSLRRSFEDKYNDVRVRQFELDQAEIYSQLRRSEIDVALTYDLDLPSDLTFEPILEMPPFVLVNEAHPLASRDEVDVADLDGLPMVLLDLPFSSDYFLSTFNARDARPMVVERTRDLAVMRSLVANGYGYSIANIRPLNDISPDGKPLKFLDLKGDIRPLRMGLLTAADTHSTNVVQAFSDHCRYLHDTGQFLSHGNSIS